MNDLIAYCKEYWQYIIVLALAIVLLIFAFKKARKSYKRYYADYRKQESQIKHLQELKAKYNNMTSSQLAEADGEDLLEGLALSYQLRLQKFDNMEKEFAEYNKQKQFIYALDIFSSCDKPSLFFKENGRELTEIIVPALEYINLPQEAKQIERLRIMFDDKDETTSINQNVINEIDAFAENVNLSASIKKAAIPIIQRDAELLANDSI